MCERSGENAPTDQVSDTGAGANGSLLSNSNEAECCVLSTLAVQRNELRPSTAKALQRPPAADRSTAPARGRGDDVLRWNGGVRVAGVTSSS